MVPVTQRRFANLDDDDDLYDPAYPGLKVVRDGGRIRVPIQLTDGAPPAWMRLPRRPVFDAAAHQPRYAVVDASDPHVQAAERAYEARNAYLRDAWRGRGTTAPPAPRDGESPRDAYIRQISNMWRMQPGQADPDDDGNGNGGDADDIEAQRQRWLQPGARPGTTKDAAISDRAAADEAYLSYVHRLTNAWRT
jgi:hypothetical protein